MAHRHRPLPYRALALTITALVALTAPAFASAVPTDSLPGQDVQSPRPHDAALAQERYYHSYGEPADGENAVLATERYLSSYGTPQPPTTSTSTVAADPGPTWTAAIIVGTVLSVLSAGIGVLAGRASARARHVTA
jgi:hypothetical protein